ncbi:MAG: hypothetical protein ABI597_02000 [Gammaproteobacteria bacterium]
MGASKGFTLDKDELKEVLELILEKSGMLKGLGENAKSLVVEETMTNLSNAGVELNRDNIANPEMQKKLGLALAATHVAQNTPKNQMPLDLQLLFKKELFNDQLKSTATEKKLLQNQIDNVLTQFNELRPEDSKDFIDDLADSLKDTASMAPTPKPSDNRSGAIMNDAGDKVESTSALTADMKPAIVTISEILATGESPMLRENLENTGKIKEVGVLGNMWESINDAIKGAGLDNMAPRPAPPQSK